MPEIVGTCVEDDLINHTRIMDDHQLMYRKMFRGSNEPLSNIETEKARSELNETDENRKSGIQELRDIMTENEHTEFGKKLLEWFEPRKNEYLIRFLRARKYDVKKAYDLMKGYMKFREKYPGITDKLTCDSVRDLLENSFPGILPVRDKQGRFVLIFSVGSWDSNVFSFETVLRGYVFILEQLLENEMAQINGFVLIENFKNYSIAQALSLRPSDLKKMVDMLQGSFPARFKGVHFIYQPWYFTWTYAVVKPFLKKKLASRVHLHGYNLEKLFEAFDKTSLPEDFGGSGPPYDPHAMIAELFAAAQDKDQKELETRLDQFHIAD
uniref:RBLP1 n=1 Tax=Leptochiton asellus TaxID=211853 RepID=A0A8D7ZGC3_9MOLL|nr:RBLP1 [Leptochiton asellus]